MTKFLVAVFSAVLITSVFANADEHLLSRGACTSSESWKFPSTFKRGFKEDFESFLSGKMKPVRGFSEGLALRKFAINEDSKALGEYWISRALVEAKLPHIALNGFTAIVARKVTNETAGVQMAALACINEILSKYPSISFPMPAAAHLSDYQALTINRDVYYESAAQVVRLLLSDEKVSPGIMTGVLTSLQGAGAYEDLSRALWATRQGKHQEVVQRLEAYFAGSIPRPLRRFQDTAHILLARAYYSLGHFDEASNQLKLVVKSSNELAETLEEIAWSYLKAERYQEAIGTATNLQVGGLRHTFTPEAPMVMAMALNEICQYQESIHAAGVFHKDYEMPYKWLKAWALKSEEDSSAQLYPLAVQYVRKQGDVPDRVASEWIRSPLFISTQDEINLLFDEKQSSQILGKAGSSEQRHIAVELIAFAHDLEPRVRVAKMKLKEGEALPGKILADLTHLKEMVTHYRRMQAAAPVWKLILGHYQSGAPLIEEKLVKRLNRNLRARSEEMLEQLDEVAENTELIEVEIYNGASQDIIWQNAHPDYKKVAQQFEADEKKALAERTWNWGRSLASLDDDGEVWEDELGSFKANLYDNCSNKDKYLALKRAR